MSELPKNWCKVEIEQVLQPLDNGKVIQQGWSPQCEKHPASTEEWGVLKTTAVQEGYFLPDENKKLPNSLDPRPAIEIKAGDILMTCAGPRNRCGVTSFVKETRPHLMMSGKMYRFRADLQKIDPSYLEAFLLSQDAKVAIDRMKTGINDSGLNLTHSRFLKLAIPIAPIDEQKRIVAKIEELFSELDKGIESLKTVRAQLKVYRQAVLKHAFEGKLTADWREKNKDKLESADQFLQRIKVERETNYQQQVAAWKKDTTLPKPKPIQSFSLLKLDEYNLLPTLPKGWIWIKYGNICTVVRNGISQKPEGEKGAKIFRISAVRPMEFVIDDIRYIDNSDGKYNEFFLSDGDLVFTRYNGTRMYVGVCAEYKSDGSHLFPDKLVQTRVGISSVTTGYLEKAINCGASRKFIESLIRTTAGQSGISGSDIKAVPVPICSYAEQVIINNYVSDELIRIEKIENEIDNSLQKSEALRQSILKKAFSGQLIPQDPADEPATVLLERIRAEKIGQSAKKNPKEKRRAA